MADEAPPLIIPVRFDVARAAQDLQGFHAQTAQASAKSQQAATQGVQAAAASQTAAIKASATAQTKADQDASKARIQAANEARNLIARTNRELAEKAAAAAKAQADAARGAAKAQADAAQQGADAMAAAAKEAADRQKQAAAQAFADWKKKADDQHRSAMWSWEDQQAAIKKTSGEAKGFGNELAGLYKAQMALNAGIGVARAIGDELKRAADFARDTAREFISLRKSMQEVAALRGQENTNEFTVEEAKKAQASGLTPEERRDFQAQFLNYAGSQVGGKDANEQAKLNTKLTEAQGEEFGNRVAALMKSKGVNPAVGAELGGSMLEQAEGPQDVDKLMSRLGKTFEVLQKGRVPLQKALPEMSQIMAMGVSAEDAAKMYSIVSPAAAGQEGTSVQAALRAVQEMKNKGTGAEFGVKAGMGQYESVKAFATNINERQQKLMAGGMSEQQASDAIQKLLADKEVAGDYREARGLVRGFGGQGARLGGFRRYEAIEANTSPTYEKESVDQYRRSDAGQQAAREAAEAVALAERGAANVNLEELRQDARTRLTKAGRFEKPTWGEAAAGALPGNASRKDQMVNFEAIRAERAKLGQGVTATDRLNSFNDNATNNQLKEIAELIKQQNEIVKKDAQRAENQARPPLAAPPPQRNGGARMGG